MFTAPLFKIAKKWKHPKCSPIAERINKIWNIHFMEYYLAMKKRSTDTTWINLENTVK